MGKYIQPNPRQQQDAYLKPLRRGVATLSNRILIAKGPDRFTFTQERNRLLDQIYFERRNGKPPSLDEVFESNPWLYNLRLYGGDYSDLAPLDTSERQEGTTS